MRGSRASPPSCWWGAQGLASLVQVEMCGAPHRQPLVVGFTNAMGEANRAKYWDGGSKRSECQLNHLKPK